MPIIRCPRCKVRVVHQSTDVDIVHTCNSGKEALDNEDILDTLDPNWNWQGIENKVQGTDADIEGQNVDTVTSRGNRKSTHRTRQHDEFIKLR